MNNAAINRSGINGSAFAAFVVYATVSAIASASVVACAASGKVVSAASSQSSQATAVSIQSTPKFHASAFGNAGSSGFITANIKHAAASNASGAASGTAISKCIWAGLVTGNAAAIGTVYNATTQGSASADAAASVVQAIGTRIKFGIASSLDAAATGTVTGGDIERTTPVYGYAGISYAHAEARVLLSGASTYEYDGFLDPYSAIASCVAIIDDDLVSSFLETPFVTNSSAVGSVTGTLIKFASAYGLATCLDMADINKMLHTSYGEVSATAICSGVAGGVRTTSASAEVNAIATSAPVKTTIRHAGACDVTALASSSIDVILKRTTFGASLAIGEASSVKAEYARQFSAQAASIGIVTFSVGANILRLAESSSIAAADLISIQSSIKYSAAVNDSIAEALVGKANALTNSDVKAPHDRYMFIQSEDRVMIVPFEERLLVVAA